MEIDQFEERIKFISKIILSNPQKMIREEDIKNLCGNYELDEMLSGVYNNLKNVGFELITTNFLEQKYYVLTTEGKDDEITPSQYGTLALILALSKEIDEDLNFKDLKEIFSDMWESDVKYLIEKDYLRRMNIEGIDIIKITPLGKAIMKNIIPDLQLKNLLKIFKNE
ncbi:MAG: hypothetical protein EU539_03850 [Promethearchaeota archaeon]|nr:MAG: hypothetical protein EU539_03850 [Candidatus Lokiarchaeota archaeon]